jgi:hypothetical protein
MVMKNSGMESDEDHRITGRIMSPALDGLLHWFADVPGQQSHGKVQHHPVKLIADSYRLPMKT